MVGGGIGFLIVAVPRVLARRRTNNSTVDVQLKTHETIDGTTHVQYDQVAN